ncbi:MAG TPA: helix-hairpin-helix domain-containing protein, partial [Terriglobales bacterium]|nr:helix-hairpin-helix domain-containing protein [Terriglobales bacterium]
IYPMKTITLILMTSLALTGCSQQQASDPKRQEPQPAASSPQPDKAEDQAREGGEKLGAKAREAEIRTRDERERLRVEGEKIAQDLKKGARELGKQAKAASAGIRDGWNQNTSTTVNLNTASLAQLQELGLSESDAAKVVAARPYSTKQELLTRKIISTATYRGIEERVVTK